MRGSQYLVIGSGSGGAAVARRLSDAGRSVILLEAGGADSSPDIADPTGVFRNYHTPIDWDYHTVPQQHLHGRVLHIPRGRVLGGSTSLNAMLWVRGNRIDYDAWAYAGNEGWSYDDVLPLFKRIEDSDLGNSAFHSTGGPVHVKHRYAAHPINEKLILAAVESGFPFNPDINGERQDGVSHLPLSIRDDRRESTATAYLRPAADDETLTVITGATVQRLLFDGDRCIGAEYADTDGAPRTVHADDEVILAAGAIATPQLLMLSGIGDPLELSALGIRAVVDVHEVGHNLQDHLMVPSTYETTREVPPYVAGTSFPHTAVFARSRAGLPAPDLQTELFHIPLYYEQWSGPTNAVSFVAIHNRPTSRGRVTLASSDVSQHPIIDPNYLATESDRRAMVANLELNRELGAAPALREWLAREIFPGPGVIGLESLSDYARASGVTGHHVSGTCRMGPDEDSVVDPQLRVRGVGGLRIADASVFPTIPTGNTSAPTIMVGEKCANLILGDTDERTRQGAALSFAGV